MATYSQNDLVEMAYLYLVEGMTQADIENRMRIPHGTISRELRDFGITGSANNAGRSGWGARGNHCGIASPSRMGFQVTRQDVRDFMFGSGRNMTDADYFGRMKAQRSNTASRPSGNGNHGYSEPVYSGDGASSDAAGIIGGIVGIIILFLVFRWLGRIGIFAKIASFFVFLLKIVAVLAEGTMSLTFGKYALAYRRYLVLAAVALFTVWGFAVMFWGDGLLWGAGIWAIGLLIGYISYRK